MVYRKYYKKSYGMTAAAKRIQRFFRRRRRNPSSGNSIYVRLIHEVGTLTSDASGGYSSAIAEKASNASTWTRLSAMFEECRIVSKTFQCVPILNWYNAGTDSYVNRSGAMLCATDSNDNTDPVNEADMESYPNVKLWDIQKGHYIRWTPSNTTKSARGWMKVGDMSTYDGDSLKLFAADGLFNNTTAFYDYKVTYKIQFRGIKSV